MFRIEMNQDGCTSTARLSGRLQAAHIDCLRVQLDTGCARRVLNLRDVTLVDVAIVRFLSDCENSGVVLEDCPAYVREWIKREHAEAGQHKDS